MLVSSKVVIGAEGNEEEDDSGGHCGGERLSGEITPFSRSDILALDVKVR